MQTFKDYMRQEFLPIYTPNHELDYDEQFEVWNTEMSNSQLSELLKNHINQSNERELAFTATELLQ